MQPTFLTGDWKNLLMVNYDVDPKILEPYLPRGTKLNLWNGRCYVTLTGFVFDNIKVLGMRFPFHQQVIEVNLRFYAIPLAAKAGERGVVFIKETTAKPAIALAANLFYNEHYAVMPVHYQEQHLDGTQTIEYRWGSDPGGLLRAKLDKELREIEPGSEEEFITWQLRGFTKVSARRTLRYVVQHPLWHIRPILNFEMDVEFGSLFGENFCFLKYERPVSIFCAEGSPVSIMKREVFAS
jgi:uncharacterized protein YqjF (DUF2071 family)